MHDLTPAQRRCLRALAHKLSAIVMIGRGGLSAAVKQEIDKSLAHHELMKIKIASEERAEREAILTELCDELGAAPVQHIGKTLVLYRRAAKPKLVLPE